MPSVTWRGARGIRRRTARAAARWRLAGSTVVAPPARGGSGFAEVGKDELPAEAGTLGIAAQHLDARTAELAAGGGPCRERVEERCRVVDAGQADHLAAVAGERLEGADLLERGERGREGSAAEAGRRGELGGWPAAVTAGERGDDGRDGVGVRRRRGGEEAAHAKVLGAVEADDVGVCLVAAGSAW